MRLIWGKGKIRHKFGRQSQWKFCHTLHAPHIFSPTSRIVFFSSLVPRPWGKSRICLCKCPQTHPAPPLDPQNMPLGCLILCLLHCSQDEKALRYPQDRLGRILLGPLPASKGLKAIGRGRTVTGTAEFLLLGEMRWKAAKRQDREATFGN